MKQRISPKGRYAWTAKVGEKGQIVIPKEARELFGIEPGDTLIILGDARRGLAIPPKERFEKVAQHVFGEAFGELDDEGDDTVAEGDDRDDEGGNTDEGEA